VSERPDRPSWDDYFMRIAFQVARRSTCPRAAVGAVIVRDKRILTTGYNGAPTGLPHCTEVADDGDGGRRCTGTSAIYPSRDLTNTPHVPRWTTLSSWFRISTLKVTSPPPRRRIGLVSATAARTRMVSPR